MIQEVLSFDRLRSMAPDEAAALLTVRRSDGATAHDDQTLEAWLGLGDANVQAWGRAQRGWRAFDDAEDDEILNAMRRDALAARPTPAWRAPQLAAAAAAIILVLGGGMFALFNGGRVLDGQPKTAIVAARSDANPPGVGASAQYANSLGAPRVFVLADGSRLTLDTDSVVDTAFTPGRRGLRLMKGQAFFEVTHDAQRPFSVQAAGREVVALGTRFDVRLDAGRVRVVLVEGRVSIGSPGASSAPVILHAGEQLVDRPGMTPVVSPADIDATLNWQRGFVTFNDDKLSVAAAELNRYSRDQLVVRDPHIAGLRVTGLFRAGDQMRFGRTLAQIHPVRVVRTGPDQLEIVAAN